MNNVAGHILLLSGHPGSGKTTTAEALAHLPGVPKVHLHSDDFWVISSTVTSTLGFKRQIGKTV